MMAKRYDKAHFIVYSNDAEPFRTNGDAYCASALRAGFDTATHHTEEALRETPFWAQNADILEQERGAGYWLWKPHILLETLRSVGPDDIVVYNDIGRYKPGSFEPFPRFPAAAINMTALSPKRFLHGFINDWLVQGHYTKRDCFIGLDADTEEMHLAAQASACPLFYMPSPESFAFLERWLALAQDPHILTDLPDKLGDPLPEFQDHRHDMAISSILLHQTGGHYVDLSKQGGFAAAEDTRRRNRHVPRIQSHAGYLSLMLERALPDDYFMRQSPDLALASHIIRNLTDADAIPVHERVTSRTTLAEEFLQMLRNGQAGISQAHLAAGLTENRIISNKLHGLSKLPDQDTAQFWAAAVEKINEAVQQSTTDKAEVTERTRRDMAEAAFHAAEAMHPDLHEEMMVDFVWSVLNEDGRSAFKAQHRNIKNRNGREAMRKFIATSGHDVILPRENELAGRLKDESDRISALVMDWLAISVRKTS
ncbi:hypothetical protein [Yoonia sp. SS1-5]|uniref:Uncharacterized protein n=1 Tax=Yoonia rhodophyticola TaxID=3137370 RepID=A0AAN0MC08_9RHOB